MSENEISFPVDRSKPNSIFPLSIEITGSDSPVLVQLSPEIRNILMEKDKTDILTSAFMLKKMACLIEMS